jgi:hypothetical protein
VYASPHPACTKGLIRLEFTGYNSLRMDHIYFCGEGKDIKVAPPKLFNHPPNIFLVDQNYNAAILHHIYLSPEELGALERNEPFFDGGETSNAFSFGMIVLSLMARRHLDSVYSYQSCELKWEELDLVIREVSGNFPFHMVNIVQELLKQNPSARLGFKDLYNRLETNDSAFKYTENLIVSILGLNPVQENKPTPNLPEEQEEVRTQELKGPMGHILVEKDTKVIYPNFLAAYLKPKINVKMEYAPLNQSDLIFQKHISEAITANQRIKYTNQDNPLGSYLGQTLVLEGNVKKEPLR